MKQYPVPRCFTPAVNMTVADPELVALASDIGVLSRFLSTARPDWSERTLRTMTIPDLLDDNQPEPFSHLSNLLSAQSDAVVAVVGTTTRESFNATIVYPDAILESSEQGHLITPTGRDWKDILYHEPASTTHEGYIADLLALLAALHPNELGWNTMIKWVVQRNRSKFQRRLERSRKDFYYGDLFDLLERWSPADSDKIPSKALPIFAPDRLSGFYLKYGWTVHPVNEATGNFQLSKDTAALLINTIGKICKEVRQVMKDASFDWLAADSKSLVDALVLLGMILNQKPVEDLFTRTLGLSALLLPREHAESISQAQADGWDPLTADDCNLSGYYALRYMRMLMSWPRAIFRFCAPSLVARLMPAKVTVVALNSPRIVDQSARTRATQSIVNETLHRLAPWGSKACDVALKWIQKVADIAPEESARRIHAEAGAMALASGAWSRVGCCGQNELDGAFLGMTYDVEIYTSQRCCHLCSRLGELLDVHHESLDLDVEFMLPVTHDVVLPWDPPLFGIPKSVLKRLRDELREKLVHLAVELGKDNAHATSTECT
ncbi:hypothetical protein LXA43DRAFT_1031784 [Ganoderma leucocontextum]|nr:hypothetical protein LXA43DRAFT_1031784 [Ganoderma leucocontextum]